MPIPEPGLYRPSNLTKKQQQEQLNAIYGVPMPQDLTPFEIDRMREIVMQHDQLQKPIRTIDLNNPPKEPYRHQKFPMMVYHHESSHPAGQETRTVARGSALVEETVHIPAHMATRIVKSEHELAEALEDGWSPEPPQFRPTEFEPLNSQYQAEADKLDEIRARKRK